MHLPCRRGSTLQLVAIPEFFERLGIGQRLDILDRLAVHDIAHRQLDDLPALGARDVADLHDLRRYVARRGVGADLLLDAVDQCLVERDAVAQADEQHHTYVAHLARRPILADDDALDDLVELFDLAVNLGRADAHTAGIERGIRASVDNHAVVRGELDPVAVAPDAGKALEVRGAILRAVVIVPEAERHRRKRRGADELALLPSHRLAVLVVHVDLHAQVPALELAAPDGARRAAKLKTGNDGGSARDGRQAQVVLA